MKNDYKLVLHEKDGSEHSFYFYCTRSQIDKVFYSLSCALFGSSLDAIDLFQLCKTLRCVDIDSTIIQLNSSRLKHVSKTH